MKLTDKEGLEIASVVKDVLEGKAVKKENKKDVKEVEEPRPEKEKEFKRKHVVKKSGENQDGTVTKEASDKQAKYKAFFDKALKKFGVSSPAELEGEKKKEFFDYVDKNYEAQNEVKEGLVDKVKDQLANLKKKKDSGNSSMDDATIMKLASLLQKKGQLAQKMEQHQKAAEQAAENDDDDRADEEQEKWEEAKFSMDRIDDEIRDLKDKARNKKEGVNEGLVDTVKQQLANLKKKKDSGNSEMDDATIMKLAQLLQKKGQLAKKAEEHDKRSRQYHDQASDAEDAGDDDRADDLQMKADDEWDEHMEAMNAIENIDDEIRDLKDKARKNK